MPCFCAPQSSSRVRACTAGAPCARAPQQPAAAHTLVRARLRRSSLEYFLRDQGFARRLLCSARTGRPDSWSPSRLAVARGAVPGPHRLANSRVGWWHLVVHRTVTCVGNTPVYRVRISRHRIIFCRATCSPLHCACVLAAREVLCCASHLRDSRLVTAPERGMTMDPRPNISSHRLHAHLQPCPRRIVGLVANGLALTGPVVASCCIGFPLFPCARVGISVARCARCVCCALSYSTRHA